MVDARPACDQFNLETDIGEIAQLNRVVPGRLFVVQHPGHPHLDAVDAVTFHRFPGCVNRRQKLIGEVALGREVLFDASQYLFKLGLAAGFDGLFRHRFFLSRHLLFLGGRRSGRLRNTRAQHERKQGDQRQ